MNKKFVKSWSTPSFKGKENDNVYANAIIALESIVGSHKYEAVDVI